MFIKVGEAQMQITLIYFVDQVGWKMAAPNTLVYGGKAVKQWN